MKMNNQFAAQDVGYAGNACNKTATEVDAPDSPVSIALKRVREEISECHYHIDLLIGGVGPALRPPQPCDPTKDRLQAASPLADEIEQIAENVRNIRAKVVDARERLTL